MKSRPLALIPGLAAAHLRHEWILTLCLVIALAAVISPLLVLMGLKHGTIQTLRERLVEDPIFREIRPAQTREFQPQWFESLSAHPGIGFLTPTILPLSSVINIVPTGQSKAELLDLIPTAPGDPLLLENNGAIPMDGEVVLSSEAARRLGVQAGKEIIARVTRSRSGKSENAEIRLKVAAVLDSRAGSLARVYAPLSFVLDVEAYKEGYAAPARGWAGDTPEPYASFDGAVLLLTEPLEPIHKTGLIINTGFGRISDLPLDKASALLGFPVPGQFTAYDLGAPGASITISNLKAIEQKLRGQTRLLLPYALNISLEHNGQSIRPVGLSLDQDQAALLGLPPSPWGAFGQNLPKGKLLTSVLWPQKEDQGEDNQSIQVSSSGIHSLNFPLHITGTSTLTSPVVPVDLMGVLRTATQRGVLFNEESGRFEMSRGGYRGFRLYAQSIDHVPDLYHMLKEEGIEVVAEVEAIERIRVLDQGLGRLFWLIALLGLFGGTAVLVASLYAAVERRRRDLGVLRLLGFARRHVFFFPVVQGILIASLGLVAGFLGYGSLALAINRSFATELGQGESFCVLPQSYIVLFCLVTLILSGLASLAAAWRATRIDPAEVIREQ
ncbi:MAG: FtsX-like permease family protein [Desulfomicrobium sp.]|nr:FtsX-like permease family protein [Desulfomicrobium sp.]NLV96098.1 FtsX-like permease family protein [Desulfovibrionales bacterium]